MRPRVQEPASWPHPSGRARIRRTILLSLVLLLLCLVADLTLGEPGIRFTAGQVYAVIAHNLAGTPLPADSGYLVANDIIWQIWLPRAIVSGLVGVLLSLAGVALQGMLMNPLADPYTVGVSAGAAVGAAAAEIAGISALAFGLGGVAAAFFAGLAAVGVVYSLAKVGGRVSVQTFLLAGVIVGTMLWSLIPLAFTLTQRDSDLGRILSFLIGTVQSADWTRAGLLLPFAAASVLLLGLRARELNVMTLGEETAAHLGVEIERFKRGVLLVAAAATAAAVSVAGIIGFVGLVTPHAARRIVGPDHRAVLPLAAIFGAILLILSDTLTRVYLNDRPVGIVTALVGAPVFCFILRRRQAPAW